MGDEKKVDPLTCGACRAYGHTTPCIGCVSLFGSLHDPMPSEVRGAASFHGSSDPDERRSTHEMEETSVPETKKSGERPAFDRFTIYTAELAAYTLADPAKRDAVLACTRELRELGARLDAARIAAAAEVARARGERDSLRATLRSALVMLRTVADDAAKRVPSKAPDAAARELRDAAATYFDNTTHPDECSFWVRGVCSCGHAELQDALVAFDKQVGEDEQAAELARLRRVEAAARAYVKKRRVFERTQGTDDGEAASSAWRTLRAALDGSEYGGGSCAACGGRGWYPTDPDSEDEGRERYCDCEAGARRREEE